MSREIISIINICLCFLLWPVAQVKAQEPGKGAEGRLVGDQSRNQIQVTSTGGFLRATIETYPEAERRPILDYLDAGRIVADRAAGEFAAGDDGRITAELEIVAEAMGEKLDVRSDLNFIRRTFGSVTSHEFRCQALEADGDNPNVHDLDRATSSVYYEVRTTKRKDGGLFLNIKTIRIGASHRLFHIQYIEYGGNIPSWLLARPKDYAKVTAKPSEAPAHDRQGEPSFLSAIGGDCSSLGETREAMDCYQKELKLLSAARLRSGQAETLNKLGDLYSALGDRQKAIDSHLKALELWRELGEDEREEEVIQTLERLSDLYLALGDKRKASNCLRQLLELKQEAQEADDQPQMIIATNDQIQGLLKVSVIKRVTPSYPPEAIAARVSGEVELRVTVSETGEVIEANVVSGPKLLRNAALEAAKQWRFEPLLLRGTPVKFQGVLTFNFALQ